MLLFNKFDLIKAVSQVLDLVNTTLNCHHLRTAFIADQLCRRLDFKRREHHLIVLGAMMHDLGVVPLGLNVDNLLFEDDLDLHSRAGWVFLRTCPQLVEESWLIRFHHFDWPTIGALPEERRRSGELANLINLADHIDVSARSLVPLRNLRTDLKAMAGRVFAPDYVEAALDLLSAPDFFSTLTEAARHLSLEASEDLALNGTDTTDFACLFSKLIDFRSPFTATHSTVVASLGLMLHQLSGGREEDAQSMYLAGLLHDVGKLGVPLNLIEKAGPLTEAEFAQVREHARLSWRTLSGLSGFQRVAVWGACHHERLNGSGYPQGLTEKDLPMESRMVAVADVFTALTEDRPYRSGLPGSEALEALEVMARSRALDGDLVELVHDNLNLFKALRHEVFNENRAFLHNLVKEMNIHANGRLHPGWWRVLGGPSALLA